MQSSGAWTAAGTETARRCGQDNQQWCSKLAGSSCIGYRSLQSLKAGHSSFELSSCTAGPAGAPLKLQGKLQLSVVAKPCNKLPADASAVPADSLYPAAPKLCSSREQQPVSALAGLQHSLRFFDEQDKLAKALLQKRPVGRAAMQAQNGGQPDSTSPDRQQHFLAPAAADALPHWSGGTHTFVHSSIALCTAETST